MQSDVYVPGENSIKDNPVEVMQYANALATQNGFTSINHPPSPDLRDPDMVFPGDKLKLPDGRLLQIIMGETIWKVAGIQYKKDYARLLILERQILSSDDAKKKPISPEMRARLDYMDRLAVTLEMRNVFSRTEKILTE